VDAKNRAVATPATEPDRVLDLEVGAIAAGGGCVARAPDGRVVFVRHSLPGERVRARVTSETTSFLRADAVEVLDPSPDRVEPVCPHAGPGRCGGCDFQHVAPAAQRRLKEDLVAEQLARIAKVDLRVDVEAVDGAPGGLGWRTRVAFAVDSDGTVGLRRHRSHDIEPVAVCPIATDGVTRVGVASVRWIGARQIEVFASPDGGTPVVLVETGRNRLDGLPDVEAGLVWKGRTLRAPDHVVVDVLGNRFEVHAGVFWQVHPQAAPVLTRAVLEGTGARPGDRVTDLYAGAGLFTVALARAVGPTGVVTAVERSGPAVADLKRNVSGIGHVEVIRADVSPGLVARRIGRPDVVVLDPARAGAGPAVMAALRGLDPPARRIVYVSCEPAPFARDLRVLLDGGWSLRSLRAFDLFPMTEHVELVGVMAPPGT
jgi:tRNA/tmRNA/rRNA uracil-C5-methylase (TrmA/RlmC/RlmD family)